MTIKKYKKAVVDMPIATNVSNGSTTISGTSPRALDASLNSWTTKRIRFRNRNMTTPRITANRANIPATIRKPSGDESGLLLFVVK